jgi:hypothetical protein
MEMFSRKPVSHALILNALRTFELCDSKHFSYCRATRNKREALSSPVQFSFHENQRSML